MRQAGGVRRRALLALFLAVTALAVSAAQASAFTAYVSNLESNSVSAIDTKTGEKIGSPIAVGEMPRGIAVTPDAKTAYVADFANSGLASVIDTASNEAGTPIKTGGGSVAVAAAPDGRLVYVANSGNNTVVTIDTQTNAVVGSPITEAVGPAAIAVSPDGKSVYVVSALEHGLYVVDAQTRKVGPLIHTGAAPRGIAITPDGRFAYLTDDGAGAVTVFDTATNKVLTTIPTGKSPSGIAITPDGSLAYVSLGLGSEEVVTIDTATNEVVGTPIQVGKFPAAVAITPDGKEVYVTNSNSNSVSVIDARTREAGPPIMVGSRPLGVAITPNLPPIAALSAPQSVRLGAGAHFDASASDRDGSIASLDWSFGDGATLANGGPAQDHAFSTPGPHKVTVTATDDEGCSATPIFTGQTAYCQGSPAAAASQTIEVVLPAVKVRCPASSKPKGCRFTLQALTKRRGGKAEAQSASVKVRPGRTATVPLQPTGSFIATLATAKAVLVRQTAVLGKRAKRTSFQRLKIVN